MEKMVKVIATAQGVYKRIREVDDVFEVPASLIKNGSRWLRVIGKAEAKAVSEVKAPVEVPTETDENMDDTPDEPSPMEALLENTRGELMAMCGAAGIEYDNKANKTLLATLLLANGNDTGEDEDLA